MFWASKGRRSLPPSGSAILSTQSLSHGLRSAPIHTCHAHPWHSSRSPVDCNMPGSPQAAPASVTSLGTLKDYDPATWCQASISLHDPCNPSVSTVTQAVAPLSTASPSFSSAKSQLLSTTPSCLSKLPPGRPSLAASMRRSLVPLCHSVCVLCLRKYPRFYLNDVCFL